MSFFGLAYTPTAKVTKTESDGDPTDTRETALSFPLPGTEDLPAAGTAFYSDSSVSS